MDARKTGHNDTGCVGDDMDGELIRDSGKQTACGTPRGITTDTSVEEVCHNETRGTRQQVKDDFDGIPYIDDDSDIDGDNCRDIDNGKDGDKYEISDRDNDTCRDIDNGKDGDQYKISDRDNDDGKDGDQYKISDRDNGKDTSRDDGSGSVSDTDAYSLRGASGDVSDCQNVGNDFKVKCYERRSSKLLTSSTDADGDKVIDPYGKRICFHRPKYSDNEADTGDAEAPAKSGVISINSDSDDENELVESKKGQLYICGNSTFCRIDSQVSKHRGQRHIRHYIIKEDRRTDIIGETGLEPLDELLRVNGKKLKDLEQKEVRRIFRNIELNERTNDVNITLNIRRWLSSTETGPLHEREWIQVKAITIDLVLEPVRDLSQERDDTIITVSRWTQSRSAVSFSVRKNNFTVRKDKNLNRGCIDIEGTNGVKKNIIRCNSQDLFVSNVALANDRVGSSVMTNRVNCEFYAELFSGFDTSPMSAFRNYLFCVRLRVQRPTGFAFLSSDIRRGNTNAIFIDGRDDFHYLKRHVDERCFVIRSIGSSDLFQSLIYRDRFMAYDEESGHIYWKQISKKLQDAFVAGQEKSRSRTPEYYEAVNALRTCWFTRSEPECGFHKRTGKASTSCLCGIKQ